MKYKNTSVDLTVIVLITIFGGCFSCMIWDQTGILPDINSIYIFSLGIIFTVIVLLIFKIGKQSKPTNYKRLNTMGKSVKEQWEENKTTMIAIWSVCALLIVVVIFTDNFKGSAPDPCDCINVLNVPTQKVGIGMPIPIGHMSDADFEKYKSCFEHYTSHWGSMKKCGDF